jgi:hypothetical protein
MIPAIYARRTSTRWPCITAAMLCLLAVATSASAESRRDSTMLMTESKWSSLTEAQRGLYIKGFLETVSFVMYS